jgi:hypothetical protein
VKVLNHQGDRLTLGGIRGGTAWAIVFSLFGVAVVAACAAFMRAELRASTSLWASIGPVVGLSVGILIGVVFIGAGTVTLCTRERLTLDRVTHAGEFITTNLITRRAKTMAFTFDRVVEVHIDIRHERTPGGRRGGGTMRTFEAALRIDRPRRKVVLDSTSNGRDERVRSLASEVASFLGVPLVEEPDPKSLE